MPGTCPARTVVRTWRSGRGPGKRKISPRCAAHAAAGPITAAAMPGRRGDCERSLSMSRTRSLGWTLRRGGLYGLGLIALELLGLCALGWAQSYVLTDLGPDVRVNG